MIKTLAMFSALIASQVCFADGTYRSASIEPNTTEKIVGLGLFKGIAQSNSDNRLAFYAQVCGWQNAETESNDSELQKSKNCFIKIQFNLLSNLKNNGEVDLADVQITAVTQEEFTNSVGGVRKYTRTYGTLNGLQKSFATGTLKRADIYAIGFGYSMDVSTDEERLEKEERLRSLRERRGDFGSLNEYVPFPEEVRTENKKRRKTLLGIVAQLSVDVLGLSNAKLDFSGKSTDLAGVQLVRAQSNFGVAVNANGSTQFRLSIGMNLNVGVYDKIDSPESFKIRYDDLKMIVELDSFARTMVLARLAHLKIATILQAGFTLTPDYEEIYSPTGTIASSLSTQGSGSNDGNGTNENRGLLDRLLGGKSVLSPYIKLEVQF